MAVALARYSYFSPLQSVRQDIEMSGSQAILTRRMIATDAGFDSYILRPSDHVTQCTRYLKVQSTETSLACFVTANTTMVFTGFAKHLITGRPLCSRTRACKWTGGSTLQVDIISLASLLSLNVHRRDWLP